jgi:hypothetical protein
MRTAFSVERLRSIAEGIDWASRHGTVEQARSISMAVAEGLLRTMGTPTGGWSGWLDFCEQQPRTAVSSYRDLLDEGDRVGP